MDYLDPPASACHSGPPAAVDYPDPPAAACHSDLLADVCRSDPPAAAGCPEDLPVKACRCLQGVYCHPVRHPWRPEAVYLPVYCLDLQCCPLTAGCTPGFRQLPEDPMHAPDINWLEISALLLVQVIKIFFQFPLPLFFFIIPPSIDYHNLQFSSMVSSLKNYTLVS